MRLTDATGAQEAVAAGGVLGVPFRARLKMGREGGMLSGKRMVTSRGSHHERTVLGLPISTGM